MPARSPTAHAETRGATVNQPPVFRIRITYNKLESLRYIGNLDLHRIWERSFRRARLPLAYSQGFHPQPRINQACPLPLGMTSENDLVEVWFEQVYDLLQTAKALKPAVPPGLEITAVHTVDLRAPSLPTLVAAAIYHVTLLEPVDPLVLNQRVEQILATKQIIRTRRDKPYDLRPLIQSLAVQPSSSDQPALEMALSAREGATGRAEEVLASLQIEPFNTRIHRSRLILLE